MHTLLARFVRSLRSSRPRRTLNPARKPWLEELEPRTTPTTICSANPTYEAECQYLDNLIPTSAITITAQQNGNWSNPATWGGRLPANGDNVWIPNGITVTVDRQEPGMLRSILDNGVLQYATNVNTSLLVDTVVVGTDNNPTGNPEGIFTMGTAANPIQANVTATLTFADDGSIASVFPNDYQQLSRGFISMNTASFYGAQVTPYVTMANAAAGSTTLQLGSAPINWKVGDTLLIPGTSPTQNQDEQIAIAAISGTTVTLAHSLAYTHASPAGQPVYVADEVRNVVVQSQNTTDYTHFGAVMFMHTDQETVAYTDFLNLGRTNKAVPLNNAKLDASGNVIPGTGTNQVGRYAMHFHRDYWPSLTQNDPPILVLGNFQSGSPGWGYDNHSSNVDFEQDVALNDFGAGFATEAGNEIGTFNRCLSVGSQGVANGADFFTDASREKVNDFGFSGSGFWMQSAGCTMTNDIALDNQEGFVYYNQGLNQGALGTTQFWAQNAVGGPGYGVGAGDKALISTQEVQVPAFSNDIVAESVYALQFFWHLSYGGKGGPGMSVPAGVQTVVDRFMGWDVSNGISIGQWSGDVKVQNSTVTAAFPGSGTGIGATFGYATDVSVANTNVSGFHLGLNTPSSGLNVISGGTWNNQVNFEIKQQNIGANVANTQNVFSGSIGFGSSGTDYELDSLTTVFGNLNDLFLPQQAILPDGNQLYYQADAPSSVPFPTSGPSVPGAFVGLTAQQIWTRYGVAFGGFLAPGNATSSPSTNGVEGTPAALYPYNFLSSPYQVSSGPSYTLKYIHGQQIVADPTSITLQPGWNVITRTVDNRLQSWLVDYTPPAVTASLGLSGLTLPRMLAGNPVTFTVSSDDASGNVVSSYTGTVRFTSSDPSAVLPAPYTFTAADGGSHTFTVTFNTTGSQSLTVTDTSNTTISGTQSGLQISAPASVQFSDPGFETPNVAPGQFQTAPSASPWLFTGAAGVASNGSRYTSQDPSAPQGTQVAFLQGTSTTGQSVNLPAGTYSIGFFATQDTSIYQQGNQTIAVVVDGKSLATFTPPSAPNGSAVYSVFSTPPVTLAAGRHTVAFVGLGGGSGFQGGFWMSGQATALIDNVVILLV